MENFERILLPPDATIRDAIEAIDRGAAGIAVIADGERRLVATVTDGDIRRAILGGVPQDAPATETVKFHAEQYEKPTVVAAGTEQAEIVRLMLSKFIRHLPLVDEDGRLVDVALLSDFIAQPPLSAVVMAGGYGKRLRPLTDEKPKPMLEVGGRPLMEKVIGQLRAAGIRNVRIATHYLSEEIENYFGDGSGMDINIDYLREEKPLGTAGALGSMERPVEPMLVINGDILTDMNFQAMHEFHREQGADLTVGVRKYDFQVPFGVVETEGIEVSHLEEKPSFEFFVNAGVYLLEPVAWDFIPEDRRFDMTGLIAGMLAEKKKVISFPITEYWVDIGGPADYRRAQSDAENGRI